MAPPPLAPPAAASSTSHLNVALGKSRRSNHGWPIAVCSYTYLIFWDLLFLLEYMSVLYERDDGGYGGDEE